MASAFPDLPSVTRDALLGGRIEFFQPAKGYRVNIDAILLAAFAKVGRDPELTLDLGSGVGAVSLVLYELLKAGRFTLIERDPELSLLAQENLASCGVPGEVLRRDLVAEGLPPVLEQAADLVVSNPPFFSPENNREAEHPLARAARFGIVGPFLQAAARALRGSRGRAVFVYPARDFQSFLAAAESAGLVAKRLRYVHARSDANARVALVELRRAKPGGLVVEAPLVEWSAPGIRSPELSTLLNERTPSEAISVPTAIDQK